MEQYTSRGLRRLSALKPRPSRSIVPGRKFSTTTSLLRARVRRISRPSRALRLSVTLFLPRLTDMKYVASPATNGGHFRVSSPLPGSSTLTTSAPMSASIMVQNGPASTRVRSSTRTPSSGLVRATFASLEEPAHDAAGHRVDAIAGAAGAAPEQTCAVERVQAREVIDVVHGLDGDEGADAHPPCLGAVADEAGAPLKLDEGDVKWRAKTLGSGMQGRVRHDLADPGHRRGDHSRRMMWAVSRRRRDDEATPRAARGRDAFDHCIGAWKKGLNRGWAGLGAGWVRSASRLIVGVGWVRSAARLVECAGWPRPASRLMECAGWLRSTNTAAIHRFIVRLRAA